MERGYCPAPFRVMDMTLSKPTSHIIGSLFAILLSAAVALPAAGEGLRIRVGDLAQPAAARDFARRLDAAARSFCWARYRPNELDQIAACQAAVREEGLAALSQGRRDALAHSLSADRRFASMA